MYDYPIACFDTVCSDPLFTPHCFLITLVEDVYKWDSDSHVPARTPSSFARVQAESTRSSKL